MGKEKKEIGKLIELLNEYETFKVGAKPRSLLNGELFCDCIPPCEQTMYGVLICAKPYGFIKWLVENDKINKDLISRVLIRAYVSPENHVSLECEFHDYYESLLMLLSISDTPIEDLISYLK